MLKPCARHASILCAHETIGAVNLSTASATISVGLEQCHYWVSFSGYPRYSSRSKTRAYAPPGPSVAGGWLGIVLPRDKSLSPARGDAGYNGPGNWCDQPSPEMSDLRGNGQHRSARVNGRETHPALAASQAVQAEAGALGLTPRARRLRAGAIRRP